MTTHTRASFEALLLSPTPEPLRTAINDGSLDALIPELREELSFMQRTPYHHLTNLEHSLATAWAMPATAEMRLLGLLHDLGKKRRARVNPKTGHEQYIGHPEKGAAMVGPILERLGYPAEYRERMARRINDHMLLHMGANDATSDKSLDKILLRIGSDLEVMSALQLADISAMAPRIASTKGAEAIDFGRRLRARQGALRMGARSVYPDVPR